MNIKFHKGKYQAWEWQESDDWRWWMECGAKNYEIWTEKKSSRSSRPEDDIIVETLILVLHF